MIIPVQDFGYIGKADAVSVSLCGDALFLHLGHGKAFINKGIGYDKYGVPIHSAQMEIQHRTGSFQAGFHGIVQVNSKHPGEVNRVHGNGIRLNFVRNVDGHLDILIHRQEQLGI